MGAYVKNRTLCLRATVNQHTIHWMPVIPPYYSSIEMNLN
jgi:hypothetical protein